MPLLLLDEPRDREEPVREVPGQNAHGRHRDRGDEREPRVDEQEDDRRGRDHHRALDPLDDPPADEVADGVDVVRRARDHLAGRVAVEEGARIAEVGVVEEPAQARLDGDPDPRGREPPREVDEEADDRDGDDQPEQRQEPVAMLPFDRIVDHELGQHGNRDREPGEGERARETEPDQAALLPPEGEEPPQGGADGEIGRVDGAHGRETPGRAEARGWRVDRRSTSSRRR